MTITFVPNEDPITIDPAGVLILDLARLPQNRVVGIYTIHGVKNRMPERALFLHPTAADCFLKPPVTPRQDALVDLVVVSDIFRSPESSLEAVRAGRGAAAPGYSGHNYGLSIDLDVAASMRRSKCKTKAELDTMMVAAGFYCHRRDHKITPLKGESHHYNFLGIGTVIAPRFTTTSGYLEAAIQKMYGEDLVLDARDAQAALKRLKLYSGEVDGLFGRLSKEALRAFQRTWRLPDTGLLDKKTQRTLAYVACERRVV